MEGKEGQRGDRRGKIIKLSMLTSESKSSVGSGSRNKGYRDAQVEKRNK